MSAFEKYEYSVVGVASTLHEVSRGTLDGIPSSELSRMSEWLTWRIHHAWTTSGCAFDAHVRALAIEALAEWARCPWRCSEAAS